jgi:hypothetical protein
MQPSAGSPVKPPPFPRYRPHIGRCNTAPERSTEALDAGTDVEKAGSVTGASLASVHIKVRDAPTGKTNRISQRVQIDFPAPLLVERVGLTGEVTSGTDGFLSNGIGRRVEVDVGTYGKRSAAFVPDVLNGADHMSTIKLTVDSSEVPLHGGGRLLDPIVHGAKALSYFFNKLKGVLTQRLASFLKEPCDFLAAKELADYLNILKDVFKENWRTFSRTAVLSSL